MEERRREDREREGPESPGEAKVAPRRNLQRLAPTLVEAAPPTGSLDGLPTIQGKPKWPPRNVCNDGCRPSRRRGGTRGGGKRCEGTSGERKSGGGHRLARGSHGSPLKKLQRLVQPSSKPHPRRKAKTASTLPRAGRDGLQRKSATIGIDPRGAMGECQECAWGLTKEEDGFIERNAFLSSRVREHGCSRNAECVHRRGSGRRWASLNAQHPPSPPIRLPTQRPGRVRGEERQWRRQKNESCFTTRCNRSTSDKSQPCARVMPRGVSPTSKCARRYIRSAEATKRVS